jgi:hypothetical protein
MKKCVMAGALSLAVLSYAGAARADDRLVRFEGGIGEIPVSTPGAANVVRGVSRGGQPWVIARLSADVKTDGRISVDGRGLLLAGGNAIGTNGNQSVRAMLFCGTASFNSDLVPLEANGDFRIEGMLNALPPDPCESPVLLIVNAGGRWFAAGIQEQ